MRNVQRGVGGILYRGFCWFICTTLRAGLEFFSGTAGGVTHSVCFPMTGKPCKLFVILKNPLRVLFVS